jgi:hypothetical protein
VWRWFHGETKDDAGKYIGKRWPEGLIVSEAFARCPPVDDAEREALVTLFAAIESGAITGAAKGIETAEDRQEEERG